MQKPEFLKSISIAQWAVLAGVAIVYLLATVPFLSPAYYDLGDGNYLYVSMRMTQGVKPYRDILAPQPPVHLFTGAALVQIGNLLGGGDARLYTVRIFNIALHLSTMLLLAAVAFKMLRRSRSAVAAAVIYILLPIGFWWTQMYESEQVEVFFLLAGLWFFLDFSPKGMALAAPFHVLAIFTNMTAVPYVFLYAVYLLFRRWRLLIPYLLPMAILGGIGIAFMEVWSGGYYLNNVFFNQVGTYPKEGIIGRPVWQYMLGKIVSEGGDVMIWEGGYVILAFLGMVWFAREGSGNAAQDEIQTLKLQREFSIVWALGCMGAITFATKGGTADYIFTLGEPAVAVFAGYLIAEHLWPVFFGDEAKGEVAPGPLVKALLAIGIVLVVGGFGVNFWVRNITQGNYELGSKPVTALRATIETHAPPDAEILAPPFFGFLTERKIVGEYSEQFIWNIKYITEVYDKKPGDAVALFNEMAGALEQREIPIVLIDRNQTYQRKPVREALDANYERAPGFPNDIQMLNTTLGVYVPKK